MLTKKKTINACSIILFACALIFFWLCDIDTIIAACFAAAGFVFLVIPYNK